MADYYALLRVTEEELANIAAGQIPIETTVPGYYSVDHAGRVTIWPKFVPDRMQLLVSLGEK